MIRTSRDKESYALPSNLAKQFGLNSFVAWRPFDDWLQRPCHPVQSSPASGIPNQDREYARPEQTARPQFSTSVLVWRCKSDGKAKERHKTTKWDMNAERERQREQRYRKAELQMNIKLKNLKELIRKANGCANGSPMTSEHLIRLLKVDKWSPQLLKAFAQSLSAVSTLCTGPWN